ncbi:MAG TPA: trigger factor family protein, partial [Opitutales bacterium]|nr:trigger factor family protein [Opitutales bacterium]
MKITVQDLAPTRKTITVSVPVEDVQAQESALLKEFIKQARVPGFRPGKAPESLVRTRFHKAMAEELNNKLASEAYEFALKESGVEVYG